MPESTKSRAKLLSVIAPVMVTAAKPEFVNDEALVKLVVALIVVVPVPVPLTAMPPLPRLTAVPLRVILPEPLLPKTIPPLPIMFPVMLINPLLALLKVIAALPTVAPVPLTVRVPVPVLLNVSAEAPLDTPPERTIAIGVVMVLAAVVVMAPARVRVFVVVRSETVTFPPKLTALLRVRVPGSERVPPLRIRLLELAN